MKESEDVPSLYRTERAKYKELFPKVRTHHLKPHERGTDDTEFNLFPWTETSHAAWHRLFHNLTPHEVWPMLVVAHRKIWHSRETETKPVWRWGYRTLFRGGDRREFSHVRGIGFWRERWLEAFGGPALDDARYVMRCMMMCMAFGHKTFTDEVKDTETLRTLVVAIPPESDRAWAFVTCFEKPLSTDSYGTLKRQISSILEHSGSTRPERKSSDPPARP